MMKLEADVELSRWIGAVARRLLGEPNDRLSAAQGLRFGRKGSLSVNLSNGTFFDHEVGKGGGVLDLIHRETGLTGRAAVDWLKKGLHADVATKPRSKHSNRSIPDRNPGSGEKSLDDHGRKLWQMARPIETYDPAGSYLRARGCTLPPVDGDLRWHSSMQHPSGWIGPALVALITDIRNCKPLSLHRTWIDTSHPGSKAPIDRPRLLLKGHHKRHGVIRLWPDEEVTSGIALGEGIETMLAAARGFEPAWATIDAGNLAAFPVLPGIDAITIIADHDQRNPRTGKRPGIEAALALARRYVDVGLDPTRSVRIWTAEKEGADFADMAAEDISS